MLVVTMRVAWTVEVTGYPYLPGTQGRWEQHPAVTRSHRHGQGHTVTGLQARPRRGMKRAEGPRDVLPTQPKKERVSNPTPYPS